MTIPASDVCVPELAAAALRPEPVAAAAAAAAFFLPTQPSSTHPRHQQPRMIIVIQFQFEYYHNSAFSSNHQFCPVSK